MLLYKYIKLIWYIYIYIGYTCIYVTCIYVIHVYIYMHVTYIYIHVIYIYVCMYMFYNHVELEYNESLWIEGGYLQLVEQQEPVGITPGTLESLTIGCLKGVHLDCPSTAVIRGGWETRIHHFLSPMDWFPVQTCRILMLRNAGDPTSLRGSSG